MRERTAILPDRARCGQLHLQKSSLFDDDQNNNRENVRF